jgi:Flp pilus assembly pilin Flp
MPTDAHPVHDRPRSDTAPPDAPHPDASPPANLGLARPSPVLVAQVRACTALRRRLDRTLRGEAGQGTVEYALVLLGAAAVALALVAWVARSDAVGRLFDTVLGRVLSGA